MIERRAELRLWCSDLIKVQLPGAEPAEVTANLEDISQSGACVQLEQPVAAGAGIGLKLGRHEFKARVIYCIHNEIGYFAGVQFEGGPEVVARESTSPSTCWIRRRCAGANASALRCALHGIAPQAIPAAEGEGIAAFASVLRKLL